MKAPKKYDKDKRMVRDTSKPQKTTALFGARLRELCQTKPSASHVARDLGINRQQFARYLNGTSIPRAGLIDQIARYFAVPVGDLFSQSCAASSPIARTSISSGAPFLEDAFESNVSESTIRPGLYACYHVSLAKQHRYVMSIARIYRDDEHTRFRQLFSERLWAGPRRDIEGTFYQALNNLVLFARNDWGLDVAIYSIMPKSSTHPNVLPGLQMLPNDGGVSPPKCVLMCLERLTRKEILPTARSQGYLNETEVPKHIRHFLGLTTPQVSGKLLAE